MQAGFAMVETGFILVVVVVEVLDLKLHIDDPVGAVGVHLANGVWGTLAVGLLANPDAPAGLEGLFYTGSFKIAWHSGAWHHRNPFLDCCHNDTYLLHY